jgi:hypothetical protein
VRSPRSAMFSTRLERLRQFNRLAVLVAATLLAVGIALIAVWAVRAPVSTAGAACFHPDYDRRTIRLRCPEHVECVASWPSGSGCRLFEPSRQAGCLPSAQSPEPGQHGGQRPITRLSGVQSAGRDSNPPAGTMFLFWHFLSRHLLTTNRSWDRA